MFDYKDPGKAYSTVPCVRNAVAILWRCRICSVSDILVELSGEVHFEGECSSVLPCMSSDAFLGSVCEA